VSLFHRKPGPEIRACKRIAFRASEGCHGMGGSSQSRGSRTVPSPAGPHPEAVDRKSNGGVEGQQRLKLGCRHHASIILLLVVLLCTNA
jgi:hypothetical protein